MRRSGKEKVARSRSSASVEDSGPSVEPVFELRSNSDSGSGFASVILSKLSARDVKAASRTEMAESATTSKPSPSQSSLARF
jgi:hypothetical protein